jgi:hypothetical protein
MPINDLCVKIHGIELRSGELGYQCLVVLVAQKLCSLGFHALRLPHSANEVMILDFFEKMGQIKAFTDWLLHRVNPGLTWEFSYRVGHILPVNLITAA